MSASKKTGTGAGKAGEKGNDKSGGNTTKTSNIETKANVRDAIGGIEIEMDGGWMPAVYLDEIRERVLRDTNAQGSYDHPPAKGNLALDVTAFHADHKSWGESRDQRPKILFEYKRNGRKDPDYEVGIWIDNGRVVLGPDGLPIRDFHNLPKLCSSQMEGFRMEAISRLDSRISISDFRARMMRDAVPGANAISMRKTRFRNRGRCLAWDRRAGTDFYEVNLGKEMTQDMINRNSTEELEDLSSGKVEKLQLETAGKAPARSGKRALPDNVRALRLKTAREKNQVKLEAEAKLNQENTEQISGNLESPSSTNNNVVNATKRKRTTEGRLADSLHEYVDELFEEERPSKKRRNHESPSGSPNILNARKRKRTVGEEADSNDEDADEGRTFKRSRHSNNLDLLPSAFSSTTPGTSIPRAERAYGATNMANIGRPTGPSRIQDVAAWENGEQLGQSGDTPAYGRGEPAGSTDANRVVDDRDMLPISQLEQARVQNALARLDTSTKNYLSQYGFLQLQFNQIWSETGIENPAPVLAGLDMWLPESLGWNQSTDVLLNSYGVDGRRLFNELENEIRGGLAELFNQHAPRADLMLDWRNLGLANHANAAASQPILDDEPLPAFDPPAASEPFADLQTATDSDPFAGFDPSVLSGPFPVNQPFSAFDPSPAFEPSAGFQPSEAFAPSPAWNPSEGFAPMAAFEKQISSTDAEPPYEASGYTAPVAVGTTAGDVYNLSTNSNNASRQDADDIEFQRLLDSVLAEPAETALPAVPAYPDVEQPANPTFEDSFFNDAFGIHDSPFEDPLFSAPQAAQTSALQTSAPEQTVRPDELNATGLAEDFEMFYKEPNFWLS